MRLIIDNGVLVHIELSQIGADGSAGIGDRIEIVQRHEEAETISTITVVAEVKSWSHSIDYTRPRHAWPTPSGCFELG